ncbi:hypothetical protein [Indioceanicola profundi]|uniref:hypothetical protein n=1 Tax=Indioceanicola profundi TaxID=2220096 RepID=UPI0013C46CC1|nr:hypothetical protein [Indioceanicola profundi]
MNTAPEAHPDRAQRRTLWERLDDGIASVNPDFWLAGAVFAVIVPWLNRLA